MSALLAALLSVASVCTSVDEAKAVTQVKRAFHPARATADSLDEKRAALEGIAPFDSAKVARVLVTAYGVLEHEAEPLEEARRPFLDNRGGKKMLTYRMQLKPIRALQNTMRSQLLRLKNPDAIRGQVRLLVRGKVSPPHGLKRVLAAAAGRLAARDLKLVTAPPEFGNEEKCGLFLDAIERLGAGGQDAGPWVLKMLLHKRPVIREMAAQTLAALRWPGALKPLIQVLQKDEVSRVRTVAARTLERLTGMLLGTSATAWRRWLDAEGAPFLAGKKSLGGHVSKVEGDAAGGYYFGIPQDGRSILYVLDASQSMKQKMRRGQTRRIDIASAELNKALAQLKPRQRFNIIAFANRLDRFDRQMQAATKDNVAKAQGWVKALQLKLGTNTYDALELAFNTAGRGSFDRYYPLEADTVFLLSDGAPTIQKLKGPGLNPDDKGAILAAVRRWNPFRRIVVHTIGLGLNKKRRVFMEKLAQENGGRCVSPK
ncbi:MAG: VWA domain-containing protein [Planctomycetes bacterium]|nr:VWA domain-containing protein [Planctomycetota bacterium]